jgi:GTP-binding protein
MRRIISLVGRPNVGKSTLFNRLTRSRDALVADQPGLTRDRRYGIARFEQNHFIVIDTGGLTGEANELDSYIAEQAKKAILESDAVFFMVDGRAGLTAHDEELAAELRSLGKPLFIVANKAERLSKIEVSADFYALGLGEPCAISAAHGEGLPLLMDKLLALFPDIAQQQPEQDEQGDVAKVAVIGRPNVGKSTLVNRLLGEERVLALDMPGTTRDSIYIPFKHEDDDFILIDTAGVRKKGKVSDKIEKFSVIKTLQALDEANVVVLVIDARQGVSAQDATLLGYAVDAGKALLIAVNKWDGLTDEEKSRLKTELDRKVTFIDYASIHFISALHGSGVGVLMRVVKNAYKNSFKDYSTPVLTRILEDAVQQHQPPLVKGRRIKLRYAHQGGKNPPIIVVHGNQTENIPDAYKRYLANLYRKVLKLEGSPIRMQFKSGDNPYKGKKNKLTGRQIKRKQRLKKFIRKSKR